MEVAPPPASGHTSLFSEEANIYTVDTVEGLLCTHEVRGRHLLHHFFFFFFFLMTVH